MQWQGLATVGALTWGLGAKVTKENPSQERNLLNGVAVPRDLNGSNLDVAVPGGQFSQRILDAGFVIALLLAMACLGLNALYLFRFLSSATISLPDAMSSASQANSDLAIAGHQDVARVVLLPCGVFVGMSFGFLGFALFLIGIKGEMDSVRALRATR